MIKLLGTVRTYMIQYHGRDFVVRGVLGYNKEEVTYEVFLAGTGTVPENSNEIIAQIKEFEYTEMLCRSCAPAAHS